MLTNHNVATYLYSITPIQVIGSGDGGEAYWASLFFFASPSMVTKYSYFMKLKGFVSPSVIIFAVSI